MTLPDFDALRRQYETDDALRIRQEIHARYSVPTLDYPEWVLGRVVWRGDEQILDVGSGRGTYAERIHAHIGGARYVGVDSSLGMLQSWKEVDSARVQGDAATLPFADQTFDVVMANHMLYHIADIGATLREIKRVLKPEGILIASTNSVETMPEFSALLRRAVMHVTANIIASTYGRPGTVLPNAGARPPLSLYERFSLENGAQILGREFFAVVRYDLPHALVFPEAAPAVAYLESWRSMHEPGLPVGVTWQAVIEVVEEQIERIIQHFGELVVIKLNGALVASQHGGFIHEYVQHRQPHPPTPSP